MSEGAPQENVAEPQAPSAAEATGAAPTSWVTRFVGTAGLATYVLADHLPTYGTRPFHGMTLVIGATAVAMLREPAIVRRLSDLVRRPGVLLVLALFGVVAARIQLGGFKFIGKFQSWEAFGQMLAIALIAAALGVRPALRGLRLGIALLIALAVFDRIFTPGEGTNALFGIRSFGRDRNAFAGLAALHLLLWVPDLGTLKERLRASRSSALRTLPFVAAGLAALAALVVLLAGRGRTAQAAFTVAAAAGIILWLDARGRLRGRPRHYALAGAAAAAVSLKFYGLGFFGDRLSLWLCLTRRAGAWLPFGLGPVAADRTASMCQKTFAKAGAHNLVWDAAILAGIPGIVVALLLVATIVWALLSKTRGPIDLAPRVLAVFFLALATFEPAILAGPRTHAAALLLTCVWLWAPTGHEPRFSETRV